MTKNTTIEPIQCLYYTRKAILLYERVFGSTPQLNADEFLQLQNILSRDVFAEMCEKIQSALREKVAAATLSDEDKNFLEELNYDSFITLADEVDFSLITEKHHRRKFFNEIPNDRIIDALINSFEQLWNLPTEGPYFVEVYDLGDEPVFFHSYEDMTRFLDEYDVTPYTAFEVKENCSVELYSE